MLRSRHHLVALTGTALLAFAGGCQLPWFERPDLATHKVAKQQVPNAEPVKREGSTAASPITAAADDATLAAVMQEVQDIGATNPAAQQALLAELHRSKPSMWPLIVKQFKTTLAFHDQLVSKPNTPPEKPSDIEAQMSPSPSAFTPPPSPLSNDPPSASFGQLSDPRNARPDPAIEKLFATASPANMPAPTDPEVTAFAANAPKAFAEDAAAQPLAQRYPTSDQHVVQASATKSTSAANDGAVQPALYSVEPAPATAPDKRDWQQHLQLAIDDLNHRVADGPHSTAEVHQLASLRLLQLLAGHTEEALEPIPKVSPQEQDYWSGQIFALATFLDHHTQPDDKRRAAASVTHLDEAVGHLRELGSLSLRNLAFCKKVYGYGSYDEITEPKFIAGEQVSIYIEVENYHSESTEKGYSTLLGATYELVDSGGKRMNGGEFPAIEDYCHSRRRDFHIQYGLVLPKTLTPGNYRLELAMKDRQSDKLGHASIDFEIRGQ